MNNAERIHRKHIEMMHQQVRLSDAILQEFGDITKGGPISYLLAQAAREATAATLALTEVSPTDVVQIQRLQNEVTRYLDLGRWISTALAIGKEAYALLDMRERGEISEEIFDSLPETGD